MNSHWKYAVVSRKRGKNIGSLLESASSLALTSCLVKCSHLHTLYLHAEALIVQVLNPLAERKEKKKYWLEDSTHAKKVWHPGT